MEKKSLTTGEMLDRIEPVRHKKPKPKGFQKFKIIMMDNLLLVSTMVGVFVGFGLGFAVKETQPSESTLMWIGLPGQLYLRLLKMMIVPLIACSVICGAAALDPKANGKISLIAFIFIISTNALGSAMGIGAVYMFNPGKSDVHDVRSEMEGNMQTEDILADLIRNVIPDNLFEATFNQVQTKYNVKVNIENTTINGTNLNVTVSKREKYLGKMGNPNIIGLIFACTLLGLSAANIKEKGKLFLDFIQSVSETVILVVRWFMWTTPVGVISLIAVSIAGVENVGEVFSQLGLFIAAITVGIAFQQLILMPTVLFAFTRSNPFKFFYTIMRPWMIAFAATSTAVAIPEMMSACEDKNKIDKRISRFVIPFSVTISCNGSALYIAGATVFVANLTGTLLTFADVLLIWLLVTVAAMAIPSVPSASIMTTIMILTSMNIPVDDIALLLAIEWYLDRIRSTSSVVSHTFCTSVVYSLCKGDLEKIDRKHNIVRHTTDQTIIIDAEDTASEAKELNGGMTGSQSSGTSSQSDSIV